VKLAFLFALIGYGTKAGIAPMHTWLPDAHAEAPTPVSAVLSGGVLTASLAALLRFHAIAVRGVGPGYSETLLIIFGLLSIAVAVPFLLVQDDYKRLLAYSSIENIGLAAFAIGLGAPLARFAGVLHLGVQAIAKTLAFVIGGALVEAHGTRRMDRWAGAMAVAPATGALFVVAGLGLAALPPAATFLSEWLAVLGGLNAGHPGVVFASVALLAFAFVGFAYHWTRVLLGKPHESPTSARAAAPARAPHAAWALAALLLLLGAWIPEPLRRLVEQAAAVIRP
jgi:hydrogenase-4 component F